MEFNSLAFLFFLGFVFLTYWLVPKKYQWVWLLLLSYYFYLSWRPAYGWIILLTTIVTYIAALGMEKFSSQKKKVLLLSLVIDVGILFVFKYLNFFDLTVTALFSFFRTDVLLPQFKLLLPLGISFYIFQSLAYLVDVYKSKIPAEKHLGIFALFVLFFPKIVAGPIERGGDLLPQLHKEHRFDVSQTVSGLQLFTLGLFKKVVIADNLALVVNHVFIALPNYKGLSLILAIIFFSWQIYADFSGYTDMARGVARILGFQLTENFRRPYASTSVGEFWRRWHISLSTWIKDYLYIPLGGNRKGLLRGCLNILIAFTICGIWHGAAWNFVLWGVFHGVFISLERIGGLFLKGKVKIPKPIGLFYTYTVLCVSWVFFRAQNFHDIIYILRNSISGVKSFVLPQYIFATLSQMFTTNKLEMGIAFFCLILIVTMEIAPSKAAIAQFINKQPSLLRFSIYTVVLLMIVLLRNVQITQFIYVQF